MDLDLNQLPPAYRAAFEAQQAQIAALTEANARLEHLVAEFRQAVYGKKSEKLRPDERQLAFEGEAHVEWFEGNFEDYEEDKKRRMGPDALEPKRIRHKKFVR